MATIGSRGRGMVRESPCLLPRNGHSAGEACAAVIAAGERRGKSGSRLPWIGI